MKSEIYILKVGHLELDVFLANIIRDVDVDLEQKKVS